MSYLGLLRKTCYLYRAKETQVGPRTSKSWVSIGSCRCRLAQRRAYELDYAEVQAAEYRLYLPLGTDVQVQDRVVCDGDTYDVTQVFGDVASAGHHVEALLRRAAA